MKLTATQITQAAHQLDARPVPENSQMAPELKRVFGDHTFFLTSTGLHVIEPAEPIEAAKPTETGAATGRLVKIASWTDPDHSALAAHEPEFTDHIVELEKAA